MVAHPDGQPRQSDRGWAHDSRPGNEAGGGEAKGEQLREPACRRTDRPTVGSWNQSAAEFRRVRQRLTLDWSPASCGTRECDSPTWAVSEYFVLRHGNRGGEVDIDTVHAYRHVDDSCAVPIPSGPHVVADHHGSQHYAHDGEHLYDRDADDSTRRVIPKVVSSLTIPGGADAETEPMAAWGFVPGAVEVAAADSCVGPASSAPRASVHAR
jgi:hypothetical protein